MFDYRELQVLISGADRDIDVDDLQNNTAYAGEPVYILSSFRPSSETRTFQARCKKKEANWSIRTSNIFGPLFAVSRKSRKGSF